MKKEEAILGGGCFWCLEAAFRQMPGVLEVVSGFAGGEKENPTYREVTKGATGHAEVIKIVFDADKVCYKELLNLFFTIHDPTTLNRQGNDIGTQYRSIILYKNFDQETEIRDFLLEIKNDYAKPITTDVKKLEKFWPAEEYHQHYFEKHPDQPYCQFVVAPKVAKVKKLIN